MICSSVNLFFTSNLLSFGIGLQSQPLLKSGGTSQVAQESSAHLLGVLNDILDLSKIEADALELHPQPTELPALLEGLRMTFAPQAQARGLALLGDWDAQLPQWVQTDRQRFRQILMNLLGNALKYTSAGQICLRARTEPLVAPGQSETVMLRVQVQDTGMGFAPELAEAIFQPFVQADNSITRAHNGAGLGLAISRKLALKMGGSLSARARPGQGACFELSLPCRVLRTAPAQAHPDDPFSPAACAAGLPFAAPLQILLAEDNAVNQQVMQLLLQKLGHTVTVVGDGLQALQALAKDRYDVLLLDVMMPVMDGLQVLESLHAAPAMAAAAHGPSWTGSLCQPLPQVLMVTAQAMPEDLERFVQAGASGVITKPVSLDRLCRGLRDVRVAASAVAPALSPF